jgi:hypothetical protein
VYLLIIDNISEVLVSYFQLMMYLLVIDCLRRVPIVESIQTINLDLRKAKMSHWFLLGYYTSLIVDSFIVSLLFISFFKNNRWHLNIV